MREALPVWLRIGCIGFGGPAGQIALMHRILVDEKRWIAESRFLHALNYCMLLPGPEAQQLATYIGWLMHGPRGGFVAGFLFILPGWLLITLIAAAYVTYRELDLMQGLLFGMQAATLAIIVQALLRIGAKALHGRALQALAIASFVAIFAFGVPFPLIIIAAGLIGYAMAPSNERAVIEKPVELPAAMLRATRRAAALSLALWVLPVLALILALGVHHVFTGEAIFFSKMALVSFGGAYAALAYVAQQAVERYAWLQPGEMVHGLALAETTPGPLILVLSFVGFLGAYRDPGGLAPLWAGVLGSAITAWVIFTPSFLWIFLGAPWVERLRGHARINAALAAITAAVVGVILNLSVWFALHVLFRKVGRLEFHGLRLPVPDPASLDVAALALTFAALVALLRLRANLLVTLGACAGIGLLLHALR